MVTPFSSDGSVDYDVAATLARFLVREGSEGIVVGRLDRRGFVAQSTRRSSNLFAVRRRGRRPCRCSPGRPSRTPSRRWRSRSRSRRPAPPASSATTPAYARPNQSGHRRAPRRDRRRHAARGHALRHPVAHGTQDRLGDDHRPGRSDHRNIMALKDASGDLAAAAHTKSVLGDVARPLQRRRLDAAPVHGDRCGRDRLGRGPLGRSRSVGHRATPSSTGTGARPSGSTNARRRVSPSRAPRTTRTPCRPRPRCACSASTSASVACPTDPATPNSTPQAAEIVASLKTARG